MLTLCTSWQPQSQVLTVFLELGGAAAFFLNFGLLCLEFILFFS